jgi:GT2 family glycosyltransferase
VKVAIVLASAGRPALLAEAIRTCSAQWDVGFIGVVSVPDEQSLPDDRSGLVGWRILVGIRGAAAQRNAGLDALNIGPPDGVDVVGFFDDDAVLRPDYLANAVSFLDAHPDVLGLTGRVLLDGARSGEVAPETAAAALARSAEEEPTTGIWRRTRELYGCNVVVRMGAVPDMRFDARLPLYSWLEDHDFARRLAVRGPIAKVDDCVMVHRAAASGGRKAHVRFGYSQVMNPVYLQRKGSFPMWLAAQQVFRPVAKNIALATLGPSVSWRRERLRGNVTATRDLLCGRVTPERIVDL